VTQEELNLVLTTVGATAEGGFHQLPEGATATFQLARNGVGFSVSKANAVKHTNGQLQIRTERGETCFVALNDVFACVIDEVKGRAARRAGFA
jgi:hypothetical protein